MLRRTLLRQDLFRSHAMVALRVHQRRFREEGGSTVYLPAQRALHELSSVPGVKESMIDVVHNVQRMAVSRLPRPDGRALPLAAMAAEHGDDVETWRWATRRCGPCAIQAGDLDIVDSSAHYETPLQLAEPAYHLCQLTASALLEFEAEAVCCSEVEWDTSPALQEYRKRLLREGWLLVPPIFSPVLKANYVVTRSAGATDPQEEAVVLEVWTRVSERPTMLVSVATASLLAALTAGSGGEDGAAEEGDWGPSQPPPEPPMPEVPSGGSDGGVEEELWDTLFGGLPQPEPSDVGTGGPQSGPQAAVALGGGSGLDDLVDQAMGVSAVGRRAAFGTEVDELQANLDASRLGGYPGRR